MARHQREMFNWNSVFGRNGQPRDHEQDADVDDVSFARHRWVEARSDLHANLRGYGAHDTADRDGGDDVNGDDGSHGIAAAADDDVVVSPAAEVEGTIRVEAEDLNLIYYTPQQWDQADASGGSFISLYAWLGKAYDYFDGPDGLYDVRVAYYDESDGRAAARINVDGESTLIRFDQDLGSTLPTADTKVVVTTHESVFLEQNDYFEIFAQASGAEYGRFDYIEFVPVGETPDPGTPDDGGDGGSGDDGGTGGDGGSGDDGGTGDGTGDGSDDGTTLEAFEAEVLRLTNEFRAQYGKAPLVNDERLNAAAEDWSQSMAEDDFFAHSSPSQVEEEGYNWRAWGENIAAGYRTPEQVVQGWINSPGHRANMLSDYFQEIGVGHYYEENDTGDVNYHHYWTQVFATEAGDGTYYG